ncbi:MAG TPA: ABC transporter permease [Candidatus Acidoferrales bacterium]|nr:ABC transporter permease [Candidatus Acidoferrales bacterium]
MNSWIQDLRYGVRQLRKSPGFTCSAVLILAIGIGGATAIFSALNPILFQPLPYPHAARIMMIWYADESGERSPLAFHAYREVLERNRSFESLAVMKVWQPTLNGANLPERLAGQQVSAAYFRTLGVNPVLGRDFQPSDDVRNGPQVVILSDGLWRRRFGGDRTIVGSTIRLDDQIYTVIGILPPGFENVLAPDAEVWSPLQYDSGNIADFQTREWGHHLRMVGRLRSGVGRDQARNDLAAIAATPVTEFPRPRGSTMGHGLTIDALQEDVTRGVKPALLAVFAAVGLVLLIACVNVTNLMLACSAQRQGEIAMRAALGAAAPTLARQMVTESLLLATVGGVLGMVVAQAGIRVLVALSPAGLPRVNAIRLDGFAFAFAFCVTGLVGIAVGLIPAWQASRGDLLGALRQASQRTTGQHQVARRAFVVAEVALALVLLVGAGLLLHSLRLLLAVPSGFDTSGMLSMQVQTYGRKYDDDRVCHQFFAQALDAVRQVPGVSEAAFTSQLPLSGDSDAYGAFFEGDGPEIGYSVYRYAVTPGYLEALRIPLRRGRLLDEHDTTGMPPVMLLSESLAKRKFPNQDPIGKRVNVSGTAGSPLFTVVGVVGDVKQESLALDQSDAVYTTTTQWHWADGTLSLVVRARGDAAALVPALKNAIWSVDKDQPIVRVALMDDLLAASAAERRFVLILFEAFGLVALVLAATGLYGVLAGSVTERTRELGLRAALGASRGRIVSLVLRQGMILTAVGVGLGLAGAAAAGHVISTLLFGISRLDPLTYAVVIILLAAVSAMACAIPAWRAARVDPMVALRYE